MSLKGRTALVTGSTSGIGLGIAKALAAQGANIMLNGFGDGETIARVRGEVETLGVKTGYSAADMSKPADVEALIAACVKEFGAVDILVNNAGIQHVANVDEFPLDAWDRVIQINLTSCFQSMRAALPHMKKRGWGRIINIASAHGLVASAGKSAYVAAKHGLVGLTKVTALETARTGVTCNAVCPGWVQTPLVERQVEARAEQDLSSAAAARAALLGEKQPSGSFVTTQQLAAMVGFLCSEAASEVRGVAWAMDGGWTAQ
jgi:3-hydroxybutyrate dehydrogenase